jgi:thiol-disulfide isomerase/thioredoxin
VEFFYSSSCGSCKDYYDEAEAIENNESYFENVVFTWKDIATNPDYNNEYKNVYVKDYGVYFPFFVVKNKTNTTVISARTATIEHLENVINNYIAGTHAGTEINKNIVEANFLFWHVKIDMAALSLPVLTVVLAGVDSFNPCAFFILIFLLNLLIYSRSRRRMLLIGGIFICFSGILYIVFMFVLLATLTVLQASVLSTAVGLITLFLGLLSIKDFFFFKRGASVSIPEERKPIIYRQVRDLVKTPQLATAIIGTIILAATVNFYELLCSLGLPLVYVNRLTSYDLPASEYYMYILFYNIIYVIPLIIILLIFIVTLGHRKLSEWHGRMLKLFSGIMLGSFGALFLIDYTILENIATPILLLLFALAATMMISYMWEKYGARSGPR